MQRALQVHFLFCFEPQSVGGIFCITRAGNWIAEERGLCKRQKQLMIIKQQQEVRRQFLLVHSRTSLIAS